MKCKLCPRKLGKENKSGYCVKCYSKSPYYKDYQRRKQKEWYDTQNGKEKKRAYRQKPKVKAKYKVYQKKYQSQHIERMRELKREWARKNKKEQKI